ncbi:uncharacterized protein [Dysidea avara]|uniref:uncharacterized protein n=1 Tax=Dysidea avara TaxID=196820 RepID=UPI00332C8D6C
MLTTLILLASIASIGYCIASGYDPQEKVIDCTEGRSAESVCDITLKVEYLTSMTYYNNTAELKQLRGYRAAFDSNGTLVTLLPGVDTTKLAMKPIQTDGTYRPIITVNGQMPGPTIIAHESQTLNVTVYNELISEEGITIHWHGIHQVGTTGNDGVAFISQLPIEPLHHFTYIFKASPSGTHWYHAHSGLQRIDGLYGALIVKDTVPGNSYDQDLPDQHTLILMDWYGQSFLTDHLTYGLQHFWFKESQENDPPYAMYRHTRSTDGSFVGVIPFWSGIINDKGRHFDENGQTNIKPQNLNYFNVVRGSRYRFRLIGAQESNPFRFSVEGHKLTVITSDGNPIKPIENVDYVIIYGGERYDVVIHANNTEQRNFWIWAQTLEDIDLSNNEVFFNPINYHRAEAILHYTDVQTMDISNINETWECNDLSKCIAVNCPYTVYGSIYDCINFEVIEELEDDIIPDAIYYPNKTIFLNWGFQGEATTFGSAVDGVTFRFPAYPPVTHFNDFENSGTICPRRGCDTSIVNQCACTQVIDINDLPKGSVVEMVFTNRVANPDLHIGIAHPIHIHGHYFYVIDIGYPTYDSNGLFVRSTENIECVVNADNSSCTTRFVTIGDENNFIQEIKWRNVTDGLYSTGKKYPRKDTIIVPYGGYTVIRFVVDNPGWWLLHCHVIHHNAIGMTVLIKELQRTPSGSSLIVGPVWMVFVGLLIAMVSMNTVM